MKIEKIKIENLTSFKGKVEVDFTAEPLRSAGLFAITGDTGAGKTTLLDAVCLALYNRAPRLDVAYRIKKETLTEATGDAQAIQPNAPAILLRKGERNGMAGIVFTAEDGSRWEAVWSIRVKRTGTYETPTRTLQCLSPKKKTIPEKEIDQTIQQILGLGYEQFTRTVLLAQNSFASFLRAEDKEKSALLEKLTGTEIYATLSQQIFELNREAATLVREAENRLSEARRATLSPEDFETAQSEYNLLRVKLDDLRRQHEIATAGLRWYEEKDRAEALVRQAEEAHDRANKELAMHRDEEKAMSLYDRVRPIQNVHKEILFLRHAIERNQSDEATLLRNMDEVRAAYTAAEMRSKQAEEQLAEVVSLRRDRLPIINRGQALQHDIEHQTKYVQTLWNNYQRFLEQRHKNEEAQHRLETELATTSSLLIQQREDRQKLTVHRSMFDNYKLLMDKLRQLHNDTVQDSKDAAKTVALQGDADRAKAQAETLGEQLAKAHETTLSLRHEIEVQRRNILDLNGEALQAKQSSLTRRLTLLEGAKALWAQFSDLYAALSESQAAVKRKATEQSQMEKELFAAERVVEALTLEHETKHTAFTLSQSQDIVSLRHSLREGEPCPVCGSAHHPYHTETEQELGRLMDNLQKDYEASQRHLASAIARRDSLREQHIAAAHSLLATEENIRWLNASIAKAEKDWVQYATLDSSFSDCSASVNASARHTTLLALLDSTQKEMHETTESLNFFNKCRNAIDSLLLCEEKARGEEEHIRHTLDEVMQTLTTANIKMQELSEARRQSARRISYTYQDLDSTITLSNWYNRWTDSPETFYDEINALFLRWTTLEDGISKGEDREAELREQINSAARSIADVRLNEKNEQAQHTRETKLLEGLREDFRRIFPEVQPDAELAQLNARVDTMAAAAAAAREEMTLRLRALTTLSGQQQQLETARQEHQEKLRQADTALHQWLSAYNGQNEVLLPAQLDAIFADTRDWTALRSLLHALQDEVTQTKARLEAAQTQLLEVQRHADRPQKDDNRPTLEESVRNTAAELAERNARFILLGNRLSQHEESLTRSAEVFAEQQQAQENADHWAALNALFGSADGKKFRELAQGFTFATLVEQANHHLATLSPRYVLRTLPGTLTLEILDRDMLDTRRYVSSLSGGETFVVSLALALGLASLSSHNLSIGSLFIDEGFGNLDATNLDLVMSALANLESAQGRKVGIISHTDQIRTQISPQIQVLKSPNGYSTVEVR